MDIIEEFSFVGREVYAVCQYTNGSGGLIDAWPLMSAGWRQEPWRLQEEWGGGPRCTPGEEAKRAYDACVKSLPPGAGDAAKNLPGSQENCLKIVRGKLKKQLPEKPEDVFSCNPKGCPEGAYGCTRNTDTHNSRIVEQFHQGDYNEVVEPLGTYPCSEGNGRVGVEKVSWQYQCSKSERWDGMPNHISISCDNCYLSVAGNQIPCNLYHTLNLEMKEEFEKEVIRHCSASANPTACKTRYADLIGPTPAVSTTPSGTATAAPSGNVSPKPSPT